jgi:hypothetical protein
VLRRSTSRYADYADAPVHCERCNILLSEEEKLHQNLLCDHCFDTFAGPKYSFGKFRRDMLVGFCFIAAALEFSVNAGVLATFQPLTVDYFGWDVTEIATVNFAGACLSIIVSLASAQLRFPERCQSITAAVIYCLGVLLFCFPPLTEWRMVVGLILGLKAQILFMAPFTAVFSRAWEDTSNKPSYHRVRPRSCNRWSDWHGVCPLRHDHRRDIGIRCRVSACHTCHGTSQCRV